MNDTMSQDGPPQKLPRKDALGKGDKIVNDSIHGHVDLPAACLAVIDTKQFQRLRFVNQLGGCYFVFPGASHNRFEHSLGVCHLAGQFVRTLQRNQPKLPIIDKDILCVELAGLCHDLGHGPFSHLFDKYFIKAVDPVSKWKHEHASIKMFRYLVDDNKLMEEGGAFYEAKINDKDLKFIEEMISGSFNREVSEWTLEGRTEEKAFLYEIVANKNTEIDVDKWDYFCRDAHHLGIQKNFDHNRFMKFARVINVNGRPELCVRDKEMGNLYQMFYTRYMLHRSAYQHNVVCAVEIMLVDAFKKADKHLKFYGKRRLDVDFEEGDNIDGTEEIPYQLSKSMNNMEAYAQVTDHILWEISCSRMPDMQPAKEIVERIFKRDLYHKLDERFMSAKLKDGLDKKKVTQEILEDEIISFSKPALLKKSSFRLQLVFLDFGKKKENPLRFMRYYSKGDEGNEEYTAKEQNEEGLLNPPQFEDRLIRIYSCHKDSDINKRIKTSFKKLCVKWEIDLSSPPWNFSVYPNKTKRSMST